MDAKSHAELRLIQGGLSAFTALGRVQIFIGSDVHKAPFAIDVHVTEEDTWQVLSADTTLVRADEHPIRLMTGLIEQQPLAIGDVLINGGRWRMVTVDFDHEPISCAAWIRLGLERVMLKLQAQAVSGLALVLPGYKHGAISCAESSALLADVIAQFLLNRACRLWLVVPDNYRHEVKETIAAFAKLHEVRN